tara:strand:- start:3288 stop:3611 length:324 start_codon:yes stop_codon:yes gene_type:complete
LLISPAAGEFKQDMSDLSIIQTQQWQIKPCASARYGRLPAVADLDAETFATFPQQAPVAPKRDLTVRTTDCRQITGNNLYHQSRLAEPQSFDGAVREGSPMLSSRGL